jgi:hypothetical protein
MVENTKSVSMYGYIDIRWKYNAAFILFFALTFLSVIQTRLC